MITGEWESGEYKLASTSTPTCLVSGYVTGYLQTWGAKAIWAGATCNLAPPTWFPVCILTYIPRCLPPCLLVCLPPTLPASLLACLSAYLPPCLPPSLPACLPTSHLAWLPVCLPASLYSPSLLCMSSCLPPSLPACLPVCLRPCLRLSVPPSLPDCLSVCLPASIRRARTCPHLPLPPSPSPLPPSLPKNICRVSQRVITWYHPVNSVYPPLT